VVRSLARSLTRVPGSSELAWNHIGRVPGGLRLLRNSGVTSAGHVVALPSSGPEYCDRGRYDRRQMGRPAKFSVEQILNSTVQLVADGGPARATIASIAESMGAPTGSIYHRFVSRDLLLARLWVRTAERAQAGFVEALAHEDLRVAARNAALHIPRWSRANFNEAKILLLYRRGDLAEDWPEELGEDLAELQDSVLRAVRGYTKRLFGGVTKSTLQTTNFALLDIPYAAVRRHLIAGVPPPMLVDDLVTRTVFSVLPLPEP